MIHLKLVRGTAVNAGSVFGYPGVTSLGQPRPLVLSLGFPSKGHGGSVACEQRDLNPQ